MMTNPKIHKTALDLNMYDDYGIPQEYLAYQVNVEDIDEQAFDDLEADYLAGGYKVFNSEMIRSSGELYNCRIIIAKMGFIY